MAKEETPDHREASGPQRTGLPTFRQCHVAVYAVILVGFVLLWFMGVIVFIWSTWQHLDLSRRHTSRHACERVSRLG